MDKILKDFQHFGRLRGDWEELGTKLVTNTQKIKQINKEKQNDF